MKLLYVEQVLLRAREEQVAAEQERELLFVENQKLQYRVKILSRAVREADGPYVGPTDGSV
jgi:hypothetical protein